MRIYTFHILTILNFPLQCALPTGTLHITCQSWRAETMNLKILAWCLVTFLLGAATAFQNITARTQHSLVSLVMIDPTGTETALWGPVPVSVRPGSFGAALGPFGAGTIGPGSNHRGRDLHDAGAELVPFNLSVFLPPVSPALLGQIFRLELRFDDPESGAEQDRDKIKFIIQ